MNPKHIKNKASAKTESKHVCKFYTPEAKHTPTPWKLDQDDRFVNGPKGQAIFGALGDGSDETHTANAEFIVRAVNSHEALLEAAKEMLEEHSKLLKMAGASLDVLPASWLSAVAQAEVKI
jgi:hypothetical protein